MKSDTITTSIYEVKQNSKWRMVRATSMLNLDNWCKSNGVKKWRMVGMMSISQLEESKNLQVIC